MASENALESMGAGRNALLDYVSFRSSEMTALKLAKRILSDSEYDQFLKYGAMAVTTTKGEYVISYCGTTAFYQHDVLMARGCLIATLSCPYIDQFITNYLIIKGDEARYWKVAEVSCRHSCFKIPEF